MERRGGKLDGVTLSSLLVRVGASLGGGWEGVGGEPKLDQGFVFQTEDPPKSPRGATEGDVRPPAGADDDGEDRGPVDPRRGECVFPQPAVERRGWRVGSLLAQDDRVDGEGLG